MAIPLISTSDLVVAANHPRAYTDIKNRAGQYIQTQIEIEHDSDGKHDARQVALIGETGTFTGNGTTQVVSLTNTKLTPLYVQAWQVPDTTTELVSNGGFASDTTGWACDGGTIASVAGGQAGNCCEVTQYAANLVTNGDFTTDLTGWTSGGGGAGTASSVSGGQSGNCAKIARDAGGSDPLNITQAITVTAGKNYVLTGYYKFIDGTLSFPATPLGYGVSEGVTYILPENDGNWHAFSYNFTAAGSSTTILLENREFTYASGMGFDTIRLYEVAKPETSQTITTVTGLRYTFTGYAKSGTSGNEAYLISAGGASVATGTSSGSWVQFTAEFTAAGTSTEIIFQKDTTTTGTMLFDTLTVREKALQQPFATSTGFYGRGTTTANSTLTGFTAGAFTVAVAENCNVNGITNYFEAWGYDTASTFTRDAGGSDPDWVEDGEQGLGGSGTAVANKVENHIETQFLIAHNDAGAHTTDPYATVSKIECNSVTATGTSQAVTLTQISTVDYVEIWKAGDVVCFASSDMAAGNAKKEGTAALQTGIINSLDTGGFHFTGTAATPYYYKVIGV